MSESKDTIEIRDPEIDIEEIMARIRQRIQERRSEAQAQGLDYDRLVDDQAVNFRTSGRFDSDLYYDLHQVRTSADTIWVSLSVVDRQVPVVGSLLTRLRRELHSLVIYYVNMLAGRQVVFNRSVAGVLPALADALDESQERVAALEKEVADLRQRVEMLTQTIAVRE